MSGTLQTETGDDVEQKELACDDNTRHLCHSEFVENDNGDVNGEKVEANPDDSDSDEKI